MVICFLLFLNIVALAVLMAFGRDRDVFVVLLRSFFISTGFAHTDLFTRYVSLFGGSILFILC